MGNDIQHLKRTKVVKKEVIEDYSVLTCRCCGKEQEIMGTVALNTLCGGWAALSLDTLENDKVFQWLLCPSCVKRTRNAAGLPNPLF